MKHHTTWQTLRDYLNKSVKLSYETLTAIRKLTAPFRHEARVEEVIEASRNYCENLKDIDFDHYEEVNDELVVNGDYSRKKALIQAMVCYFDYLGLYGGGLSEPGAGTSRLLIVGKGRRHASDGPVYLAATLDAVKKILSWLRPDIYVKPELAFVTLKDGLQLAGFYPAIYMPVKDIPRIFPDEVKQTLIYQLIKEVYREFTKGYISETEMLNLMVTLGEMLEEVKILTTQEVI